MSKDFRRCQVGDTLRMSDAVSRTASLPPNGFYKTISQPIDTSHIETSRLYK